MQLVRNVTLQLNVKDNITSKIVSLFEKLPANLDKKVTKNSKANNKLMKIKFKL
jgi:hypothetical protein